VTSQSDDEESVYPLPDGSVVVIPATIRMSPARQRALCGPSTMRDRVDRVVRTSWEACASLTRLISSSSVIAEARQTEIVNQQFESIQAEHELALSYKLGTIGMSPLICERPTFDVAIGDEALRSGDHREA